MRSHISESLWALRTSSFTLGIRTARARRVDDPGAHRLHLRVTGDRRSGRLLGAQIVGHWQAEVAKRIDILATALFAELRVDEISDLDLSYTPPLGAPWDAVQEASQAWLSAAR
jgi:hypothetical protein